MHWDLLNFFESNNIEYYLAFPSLDSEKVLEKRCYDRGNNKIFIDKLKNNLKKITTQSPASADAMLMLKNRSRQP